MPHIFRDVSIVQHGKKIGKKKWRFDRSFSVKTFSVKMEVHISRIVYKDKLLSSSAFVAGTTCAQ